MRLISKTHDYYDGLQAMDREPQPYFVRKPEVQEFDRDYPFCRSFGGYAGYAPFSFDFVTIGFCGKLYPAVRIWVNRFSTFGDEANAICYDEPHVAEFIKKHSVGRDAYCWDWYDGDNHKKYRRFTLRRRDVKPYFADHRAEDVAKWSREMEDRRCPQFVAGRSADPLKKWQIEWNGALKPVEFFRVFDPYRAWQEISMFLGNIAADFPPIPHVSDEDLCAAKGFDKWSFRKESSKVK